MCFEHETVNIFKNESLWIDFFNCAKIFGYGKSGLRVVKSIGLICEIMPRLAIRRTRRSTYNHICFIVEFTKIYISDIFTKNFVSNIVCD